MVETSAIRFALDLLYMPSRVRYVRTQPLPSGVEQILLIAAGDSGAQHDASLETGRPVAELLSAAGFFIEQILLHSDADAYRVLGSRSDATAGELRRNLALLLRWLHPDLGPKDGRDIFITRVTAAWELVKSAERRAVYDASLLNVDKKRKPERPTGSAIVRRAQTRATLPMLPSGQHRGLRPNSGPRVGFLRMLSLYISSFRR